MKHLLISFTLLGLLLGQVSAWAESEQPWQEASEAQLKQVLAGFEAIAAQGQFRQNKFFPFLKRPIHSSGHYQRADTTVTWQTDKPVFNLLQISQEQVLQQKDRQGELSLLTNDVQLAQFLYAVVSGKLEEQQGIQWQANPQGCLLGILDESLWHQYVTSIQLCLSEAETSAQLELIDSKKTKTQIELMADSGQ